MPEISEEQLQSLNEAKTQLDTLTKSGEELKRELDNLKTAKEGLERKLDDADKELLSESYLDFKAGKSKGKAEDEDDSGGDFDFDRASGKEIAAHLSGKSSKELKQAIEGISDRIAKSEEAMGRAFAQVDVNITALTNPDFTPNKDAIYKIAKSNPTWGAEKCLKQWRMENKTAIDAKAKADEEKAKEDAKALAEKGEGVPIAGAQEKELSKEEAANAAYDKAFGNSEKA